MNREIPRILTDDDLTAIRADFDKGLMDLGSNRRMMMGLITRLDLAERLVAMMAPHFDRDELALYRSWQKAAGK